MNLDKHIIKEFLSFQKNEITESIVYTHLATIEKDSTNQKIMQQIALEEKQHYEVLKCYTGQDIRPDQRRISKFVWLARLFGVTFAIKLMESSEISSYKGYARYPEMADLVRLAQDEEIHEAKLIGLINEERLEYMGSVVLGLNDALVEFTGALAGFTLALSDSKLIALTGSITGIAYIITVVALVTPFIIIKNVIAALILMLIMALLIIALFNYYYSVARGESFKKRFTEMAVLSFSVAAVSFLIGYALKTITGIEV